MKPYPVVGLAPVTRRTIAYGIMLGTLLAGAIIALCVALSQ